MSVLRTLGFMVRTAWSALLLCACTDSEGATKPGTTTQAVDSAGTTSSQGSTDGTASTSSATDLPGSDEQAFFEYVDPKARCEARGSSSLAWETRLKAADGEPEPSSAVVDPQGGLWMTGSHQGGVWLGRHSSKGRLVASTYVPQGAGGGIDGYGIARNRLGELAVSGIRHTDLIDFTESIGLFFKSRSLEPGHWRVQGLDARPTFNGAIEFTASGESMIVVGDLEYGDRKEGCFVAHLDASGTTRWSVDQNKWELTRVYEMTQDESGSIYVIGGSRSTEHAESERAVMVKLSEQGEILWTTYLEPEPEADANGLPGSFSVSRELALSVDEQSVWAVGSTGGLSSRKPRAWRVAAGDGAIQAAVDLEPSSVFSDGVQEHFAGLVVREDGIYYAWNARVHVGEDTMGNVARVARMDEKGRTTWKVEYTSSSAPGDMTNVIVRDLVSDGGIGLYLLGLRIPVRVSTDKLVGDRYGYVARLCVPR